MNTLYIFLFPGTLTHTYYPEKVKVKVAQSRPTLCNPMDYTVHEIIQARILEWVSIAVSIGSSQPRDWTQVSQVSHIACRFFTSWATRETQEYWSGLPIPSAVDLPDPGIQLGSPALQEDSLPAELSGKLYIIWIDLERFGFIVCVCVCESLSCVQLFETPCMDCNSPSPLSMEFSWQEHWSGLSFSSPGDLPWRGRPRDRTQVSWIASRLFTVWAAREVPWIH